MFSTWLLVDCNYLAWRAFHSTGGLSHNGVATGVSYGMLRDLESYYDLFSPSRTILAFDGGRSLREQVYPNYKSSRRKKAYTDEEQRDRQAVYGEIDRLRTSILPAAGFNNIISVCGYEADDIIAQAADLLPLSLDGVIISADGDLLQCLRSNVSLYSPAAKKLITARSFREKYGIDPAQWADVKALTGCSTDDVAGIAGIGPVNACKWVAGKLKPESVAYQKISAGLHFYGANMPLVRLPYPGLTLPAIAPDTVDQYKLMKVKSDLGIRVRNEQPRPAQVGFGV